MAAIARGIAHTALRSATGEATRSSLMEMMTIPLIFVGQDGIAGNSSAPSMAAPMTFLKFRRDDESATDYFGVQYLYKRGYDPEALLSG